MISKMVKLKMQCGALIGFIIKDGVDVPYGCGGTMVEITLEEANSLIYKERLT